jgi:hypothetical protein
VSASLCCHVVRLQNGYCTVIQADQFTSLALFGRNETCRAVSLTVGTQHLLQTDG